jgi:hypothetical protein
MEWGKTPDEGDGWWVMGDGMVGWWDDRENVLPIIQQS